MDVVYAYTPPDAEVPPMTQVRCALSVPTAGGTRVPATGVLEWSPTRRRNVGDDVVLPKPFDVHLRPGEDPPVVVVDHTSAGWAWRVIERIGEGTVRYVSIPESADVVLYRDLVDVDPATLEPTAEPVAAWTAELGSVQAEVERLAALGPGREVELGTSATHVVWRYSDETEWLDLVPLDTLKGDPGTGDGAPWVLTPSGDATGVTDSAAVAAALAEHGIVHFDGRGTTTPFHLAESIKPSSACTVSGHDAHVRLIDQANCPIITNASHVRRTDLAANKDIRIVFSGASRLDGNPENQTNFGNTSGLQGYWSSQGIFLCGVTGLHMDLGWAPLRSRKGAIHLLGCAEVTGGNINFDQADMSNMDGLDIGPDSFNINLSGFKGATYDDCFSFFAKATASMIPTHTGYAGLAGNARNDVHNVTISNVTCRAVNENVIRLQAADGSYMYRVHFSNVQTPHSGAALLRLGPTTYSTTPPAADHFTDIAIDGVVHSGALAVLESPVRGLRISNAVVTGNGPTLLYAGQYGTDCRTITLENVTTTSVSGGTITVIGSHASGKMDDVQLRNVHVGRGVLTRNAGTVTNLRLDNVSFKTASGALFGSTVAEVGGHARGVSVTQYASGVTQRYSAQPVRLALSDCPIVSPTDVTPVPTAGSSILCLAGKDPTGGAFADAAVYIGDGTAWNRQVTLATSPTDPTPGTPPDTTAPTVPTNLVATAVSSSQVDLTWTASTDAVGVTGYRVYRDGSLVHTTSGTGTTWSDSTRSPSTTYSYTVAAIDGAGNASAQSASASATTSASADTTAPSAPTNVVASSVAAPVVTWTASTDNVAVTGYRIYRDGSQIGTTTTATTYTDSTAAASTAYVYSVRAVDAAGNLSDPGAAPSVTTPAGGGGGSAFLTDTFTEGSLTSLEGHTSDSGHAWAKQASSTGGSSAVDATTGTVYSNNSSGALYVSSATPPTADYYVETTFDFKSVPSSQNYGISARCHPTANTQYVVRYLFASSSFRLDRILNGSTSTLGTYPHTPTAGSTATVRLSVSGTQVQVTINGTPQTAVTNGDITAAGQVGIFGNGASSASTGVHLAGITAAGL